MTLPQLIEKCGPIELSTALGLDLSTIYRWKNLQTVPEPETAFRLIRATHRSITWEEIYNPFFLKRREYKKIQDPNQLQFPNI